MQKDLMKNMNVLRKILARVPFIMTILVWQPQASGAKNLASILEKNFTCDFEPLPEQGYLKIISSANDLLLLKKTGHIRYRNIRALQTTRLRRFKNQEVELAISILPSKFGDYYPGTFSTTKGDDIWLDFPVACTESH